MSNTKMSLSEGNGLSELGEAFSVPVPPLANLQGMRILGERRDRGTSVICLIFQYVGVLKFLVLLISSLILLCSENLACFQFSEICGDLLYGSAYVLVNDSCALKECVFYNDYV